MTRPRHEVYVERINNQAIDLGVDPPLTLIGYDGKVWIHADDLRLKAFIEASAEFARKAAV